MKEGITTTTRGTNPFHQKARKRKETKRSFRSWFRGDKFVGHDYFNLAYIILFFFLGQSIITSENYGEDS